MQVSSLTHSATSSSTGATPRSSSASTSFASLLAEAAGGGETNALPKIEVPADAIKVPAFVLPEGGGGETDMPTAKDVAQAGAPVVAATDSNDLVGISGGTAGVSDGGSTGTAGTSTGTGTLGSGAGVSGGNSSGEGGGSETQNSQLAATTSSIQNMMAKMLASQYASYQLPSALNQVL